MRIVTGTVTFSVASKQDRLTNILLSVHIDIYSILQYNEATRICNSSNTKILKQGADLFTTKK